MERNQEDFRRISYALTAVEARDVAFLVLTFDPGKWKDEQEMYLALKDRWRSLAKAIRREFGEMKYVSTVEKTRAGRPHLNVIMVSRGLGDALATMPRFVTQWMKDHAVGCGFGKILKVEVARSAKQIAGYVVKLADAGCVGDDGSVSRQTVGEVAKLSQLPRNAPKGFRRLRSSPKFLPPAREESEYTGTLEKMPHPDDMTPAQRAALGRWEEKLSRSLEEREAFEEAVAEGREEFALGGELLRGVPRWDGSRAPGSSTVVVLDVGPPDGEEEFWEWQQRNAEERARAVWVDGVLYSPEQLAARGERVCGDAGPSAAVQGELF